MTGFGRGQGRSVAGTATVELRSINHRFLEVVAHLPPPLQNYDDRVRELVQQCLRRGRVTCTVTLRAAGRAAPVQIDAQLARRYHRQLTQLGRQLQLEGTVRLEHLLALPRVVTANGAEPARWWPAVERALVQAVEQLRRMRQREGRALARELLRHVQAIERAHAAITTRAPHIAPAHRARLERRLQELASDVTVDPQRIATEVALFAANVDITEELARLRSHLSQCRRAVQASGEQGRTLDFIAQEMFREANTMGSKANDYTITTQVIAIKSALDKLREQIQNVE